MTGLRTAVALVAGMTSGIVERPLYSQNSSLSTLPGSLSGYVLADDRSPAPLGGAVVTVSSADRSISRTAITDETGRYLFGDLPAGRYTLSARMASFVAMRYGAARFGAPGTAVTLSSGESKANLVLRLPRGGVIAGTIRDGSGDPVPDAAVWAIPAIAHGSNAGQQVRTLTDDRGAYRLFGLSAGDYLIAGVLPVATVGEVEIPSTEEVDRRLRELQQSLVGVTIRGSARPAAPPSTSVARRIAPIFYPGTSNSGEARALTVEAGAERIADFVITPAAAGTVSGTITSPEQSAISSLTLELEQVGPQLPMALVNRPTLRVRPTAQDPRFTFEGVPPGSYSLTAHSPPGAHVTGTQRGLLWAATSVSSTGDDVSGLALHLQPGLRLTGRVVTDGPSLAGGVTLLVRVSLDTSPSSPRLPRLLRDLTLKPAIVRSDGSFELNELVPGRYVVSADAPSGWWLRSALIGDKDAVDQAVELTSSRSDAVLTLSARSASLAGVVVTGANEPATYLTVVVFSEDSSFWRVGARRVTLARPASDGRYSITGLPAGDYLVVALSTEVTRTDLDDAGFLSTLGSGALRIKLVEGEAKTLNLQAGR